jgi:DNA repair photolyase/drug/metabolite transporter (DMT)-like permease
VSRRGLVLFVALGIIWGLPYLLIKVAVREVSPAFLVLVRTGGGALILLPLALRTGSLRPVLARWRALCAFTVVEIVVPWYALFNAERRLSSSLSGLLVATVPLVGALLALATGSDRLDRRRAAGLALGFLGVASLVGFDVGRSDLGSALSIGLVAAGYAGGPWIISHYLADLPRLGVVAASLSLCALLSAPLALLELPSRPLSPEVVASMATLTVVCTALAFVLMFLLVDEVGAMRATVVTYVNPAVAVLLGVTILGERFGVSTAAGFALIIAGSMLATGAAPSWPGPRRGSKGLAGGRGPDSRTRVRPPRPGSVHSVGVEIRPEGLRWRLAGAGENAGRLFPDPAPERHLGTGEYRGLELIHVEAARILNHLPESSRLPFRWTINAYRGCSHACTYCFARPTHAYLGLGTGEDFERKIVVKLNAVERVRTELRSRRWQGEPIAMGTNTDPYQLAEGRYHLTRGIVGELAEVGNPFSILTKSTLILRDLDVLVEAAKRCDVRLAFSVGTLDREVWRLTEPGTPPPDRRLAALRRLSEAGLDCSVLVAPVIPGLSDGEEQVRGVVAASREAGARSVSVVALHLRPGVRDPPRGGPAPPRPDLLALHEQRFGARSEQPRQVRERLAALAVDPAAARERPPPFRRGSRRDVLASATVQLDLFAPGDA